MSHEQIARGAHRSGSNCASSVYNAFSDLNDNPGTVPMPRSEGGKCGAVLAARKLLEDMGVGGDVEKRFEEKYGSVKCAALRLRRVPCNDLVGEAAELVDEILREGRARS